MAKQPLNKRPLPMKAIAVVLFAISLGVVLSAERDIGRRSESEVRGRKSLWRLVSLNALGAAAYLRFGRRS